MNTIRLILTTINISATDSAKLFSSGPEFVAVNLDYFVTDNYGKKVKAGATVFVKIASQYNEQRLIIKCINYILENDETATGFVVDEINKLKFHRSRFDLEV